MQLVISVLSKDNLVKYLNNGCAQTHRRKWRFLNVIGAAVLSSSVSFPVRPHRRMTFGKVNELGQFIREAEPEPDVKKSKGMRPSRCFSSLFPFYLALSHYFLSSHSVILELTSPHSEKHQLCAREYKPHQVAASILHAAQSLLKYLRILPFASALHFRLNNRQNFYLPHVYGCFL